MAARKPLGTMPVSITIELPSALYCEIARIALRKNSNLSAVIIEMLGEARIRTDFQEDYMPLTIEDQQEKLALEKDLRR